MPIRDNRSVAFINSPEAFDFHPGVSRSKQLPAYKRYVELENVMLERMHRKGESGLKVCHAPR